MLRETQIHSDQNSSTDPRFEDGANSTISTKIHPAVYATIAALAVVFVVSAWGFAMADGYAGLALAVVSIFVLAAVAIPFKLWRIAQKSHGTETQLCRDPLRGWLAGELDIWQVRLKCRDAVVAILLPIVAVALGMVVFAIELHVAVDRV
jgi:hypothetical protein